MLKTFQVEIQIIFCNIFTNKIFKQIKSNYTK